MNRKSCRLYRCFDSADQLLYVGVSIYAIHRLSQHGNADWFREVTRITLDTFPSVPLALEAEREAIATEMPIHNRLGRTLEKAAA